MLIEDFAIIAGAPLLCFADVSPERSEPRKRCLWPGDMTAGWPLDAARGGAEDCYAHAGERFGGRCQIFFLSIGFNTLRLKFLTPPKNFSSLLVSPIPDCSFCAMSEMELTRSAT